jgi:hypothetical protein
MMNSRGRTKHAREVHCITTFSITYPTLTIQCLNLGFCNENPASIILGYGIKLINITTNRIKSYCTKVTLYHILLLLCTTLQIILPHSPFFILFPGDKKCVNIIPQHQKDKFYTYYHLHFSDNAST